MDLALNVTRPVRALFYLITPAESMPASMAEVPKFVVASFPVFITFLFLEITVSFVRGKKGFAVNDALTSMSSGGISQLPELFGKTVEISIYAWLYQKWRLFDLPYDSVPAWILTLFMFDLGYYWFHRMAHEINFLWAFHQTHHSSEYYNLSTALRQPLIGRYGAFVFYLPLAIVGIPPQLYLVHSQLNLLYQFWIHTELVTNLGPLEWILNTASHHRVHHGRNPYCIDKNYAGFLIIWDRIFGTFEAERSDEKVVYGLIHNLKSFDAPWVHLCPWYEMWRKFRANLVSTKYHGFAKLKNVLKSVFYGPGWFSRKPNFRLGDPADLPPIEANPQPYTVEIPAWQNIHCIIHFLASTAVMYLTLGFLQRPLWLSASVFVGYMATACCIGYIFDGRWFARWLEILRCLIFVFALPHILGTIGWSGLTRPLQVLHGLTIIPWLMMPGKIVKKND